MLSSTSYRIFTPLVLLGLTTIAAFITAIDNEWTNLSSLWTTCALGNFSSLPAPLCFALNFFQVAHASTRSKLEQAVIVSFLAGLATITATEAATQTRRVRAGGIRGTVDEKFTRQVPASDDMAAGAEVAQQDMASKVIDNLTVPWLLYNCALGALAWQGIIIPAFLHESFHRQSSSRAIGRRGEGAAAEAHTLTIPLSIAFGILLPASLMLHSPRNQAFIILFLLFPVWISLSRYIFTLLPKSLNPTLSPTATFVFPIILSAIAHITIVYSLLTFPSDRTSITSSALLLLELDHAAIYLAVLYWLYLETSSLRALGRTLAISVLMGPGAGVCVGWLSRDNVVAATRLGKLFSTLLVYMLSCWGAILLTAIVDGDDAILRPRTKRRRSAKATGTFFGDLLD